jgi:superfamily II DNA/RNA helicase
VIAPTRELCEQLSIVFKKLLFHCASVIRVLSLGTDQFDTQKTLLRDQPRISLSPSLTLTLSHSLTLSLNHSLSPVLESNFDLLLDIIISTPNRLVQHLKQGNLVLDTSIFVMDEADLTLSFGYQGDMAIIKQHLPAIYQGIMVSATLSDSIQALKTILLRKPVVLRQVRNHSVLIAYSNALIADKRF